MDKSPHYPFASEYRPNDEDNDGPMLSTRDPLLSEGSVVSHSFEFRAPSSHQPLRVIRARVRSPSPSRPPNIVRVEAASSGSGSPVAGAYVASESGQQEAPRYGATRAETSTPLVWEYPPTYEQSMRTRFRRILPRPQESPVESPVRSATNDGPARDHHGRYQARNDLCLACQAATVSLSDTMDDVSGRRVNPVRDTIDVRVWCRLLNNVHSIRSLNAGVKRRLEDLELILYRYLSTGDQQVPEHRFNRLNNDDINALTSREAVNLIVEHEALLHEFPLSALREIVRELRSGFRSTDPHHSQL